MILNVMSGLCIVFENKQITNLLRYTCDTQKLVGNIVGSQETGKRHIEKALDCQETSKRHSGKPVDVQATNKVKSPRR